MGFFGKELTVINALRKKLKEITATNGWNTTVQEVFISDVFDFEGIPDDKFPAILLLWTGVNEPDTNKQYNASLDISIIVKYRIANKEISAQEEYDKLKKNILKKVNEDMRLGLSYVDHSFWGDFQAPIQIQEGLTYQFKLGLDIQYVFTNTEP